MSKMQVYIVKKEKAKFLILIHELDVVGNRIRCYTKSLGDSLRFLYSIILLVCFLFITSISLYITIYTSNSLWSSNSLLLLTDMVSNQPSSTSTPLLSLHSYIILLVVSLYATYKYSCSYISFFLLFQMKINLARVHDLWNLLSFLSSLSVLLSFIYTTMKRRISTVSDQQKEKLLVFNFSVYLDPSRIE